MGSRTAAMLEPYSDDPPRVNPHQRSGEAHAMAIQRDKAGFQLAFHPSAIVPTASPWMFCSRRQGNGPATAATHRARASGRPMDFARLRNSTSLLPCSLAPDHGHALGGDASGASASRALMLATMLKNKVPLAFGTTIPWSLSARFAAVRLRHARTPRWVRRMAGAAREDFTRRLHPRLHVRISLRAVEEGKKGELKPGEYADFIILSNDLTKVPPPSSPDHLLAPSSPADVYGSR